MKLARNSGGNTEWSTSKIKSDKGGHCKGCQKKYKDMTAAQFNAHRKAGFDDCPDD